jgi:hypothetical protein
MTIQTALVPDAQSLSNLSVYLTRFRPSLPAPHSQISFPGCAQSTDLDVLYSSKARLKQTVLTSDDIVALGELHSDLVRICSKAKERGIKVIIDAEYRFVIVIPTYSFVMTLTIIIVALYYSSWYQVCISNPTAK